MNSVLYEKRGTIGQIELNRPDKLNAINSEMLARLKQALREALEIAIEIESTDTPTTSEFNRILEADGPTAALAWRAAQSQ